MHIGNAQANTMAVIKRTVDPGAVMDVGLATLAIYSVLGKRPPEWLIVGGAVLAIINLVNSAQRVVSAEQKSSMAGCECGHSLHT